MTSVLGVRSQHITLGSTGLPAELLIAEPTGDVQEVITRLAEDIFIVVHDHALLYPGETIDLVIAPPSLRLPLLQPSLVGMVNCEPADGRT
jgi:hypothetical protein